MVLQKLKIYAIFNQLLTSTGMWRVNYLPTFYNRIIIINYKMSIDYYKLVISNK